MSKGSTAIALSDNPVARCNAVASVDLLEVRVGLADWVRVMRGHLTPEEIAERDAQAKARVAAAEQAERALQEEQKRQAKAAAAAAERYQEHQRLVTKQRQVLALRTAKASGVGIATLVCHPHLLDFIRKQLQFARGWVPPGRESIESHDSGLLRVRLSGPQLACIVSHMAELGHVPGARGLAYGADAERAIARRLYDGIGLVVDQTRISPGGSLPEILIDDRHPIS